MKGNCINQKPSIILKIISSSYIERQRQLNKFKSHCNFFDNSDNQERKNSKKE